ncbi:MAG: LysR family transcriptional regulator [Acidobacteriota bacterium]
MDLRQLQFFVSVVRRGSFAAAARDHGLDPSAVSRAVAALEESVGVRLLQRTTRRLSLTEAGEVFFGRVEALMEDLQLARSAVLDVAARPTGTLRVLAPVSFAQLNVVPLLPRFLAQHPDLRIRLILNDALLDLVEERVDVAIRLGPLEDSSLIARRLAPMVARVCASPEYLRRRGRPRTPEELVDHDCLLLDMPGFSERWRFRRRVGDGAEEAEAVVQVSGPLSTSNAVALKQCALDSMGVILQGRWIIGRELAEGTLVDLFPEYETTAAFFDNAAWILTPTRAYVPAKVRAFTDFLLEAFRERSPWEASAGS